MTRIYVGNLPFSATDAELRELFAQHGTVESVMMLTDSTVPCCANSSRSSASVAEKGRLPT